jgi:uncharacterized membrane protein (UPF0127 family)
MPGQAIVTIRDKQWDCSVASTPAEMATGLSGVPSMPVGTGMLFALPQEQIVTVTAEYMLFPLSVIFIGENLLVTELALSMYPGNGGTTTLPCKYFLEVNLNEASGIEGGDAVSIQITQTPGAPDWIAPVVTIAGALMMGVMMGKMGKTMANAMFSKPKEKPLIYGPGGEFLTATKKGGSFVIGHDYMGNLIITHTERTGEIFLQFESDRQSVYDLLKKWELKEVEKGWSVQIKDTEPRASILDEMWKASAQPQSLPQTRKRKPARQEVEIGTWAERDRIGIWLTDKRTGKTVAEWWDEDAREMFDQGWFKPGDIRRQTITGRAFEESVLDYAENVGLIAGGGKYLAQTVKDAYYWTAINKDTGEIVESLTPYTSSGRALRGGKAYASRHWKGTALIEVWRQPYHYSEKLKIEPVTSEIVTPDKSVAVIPTEPRRPRREDELEYLPDSPEFLAYTIEDIGYREKIDTAFQNAIARAKQRR